MTTPTDKKVDETVEKIAEEFRNKFTKFKKGRNTTGEGSGRVLSSDVWAYEAIDWLRTTLTTYGQSRYEEGVKAEMEREKTGQSKLDQKVIDAYENFMWNVDEAVRFVGIGAGSRMAGNINLLQTLIAQHKKDCFDTIEKAIFNQPTQSDNIKEV